MKPDQIEFPEDQPISIRERDDGDRMQYVIDLGARPDGYHVEIVDHTLIVVPEDEDAQEHNITLPEKEASTFIKNGVLTIEVEA